MLLTNILRRSDPILLGGVAMLTVLSLVLLATGSSTVSKSLFTRQLVFSIIALILLFAVARTHYTVMRNITSIAYVVLIVLLIVVLQREVVRGAASWLVIGTLGLQPGEVAKLVLVLVLAKVLGDKKEGRLRLRRLLTAFGYSALPIVLILLQPDFGTAVLLLLVWFGMILLSGLRPRHLIVLLMAGLLAGTFGWSYLLQDYQKERLLVFANPGSDPLGSGYTILQSITAFGSGGLWGRGLGYGPQSRLNFLPEQHTDFVFARIGEELGLVGVLGVLTIYGVILYRIYAAAKQTSDPFGQYLVIGVFLTLLIGVFVNAGMNLGLLPVTGVPLPLISYGGSSLVTMFLLIGLVESVLIHGESWTSEDNEAMVSTV